MTTQIKGLQIVASSDFRTEFKKYLDEAKEGRSILIHRGTEKYLVQRFDEDVLLVTDKLLDKLVAAKVESLLGKGRSLKSKEDVDTFMKPLIEEAQKNKSKNGKGV